MKWFKRLWATTFQSPLKESKTKLIKKTTINKYEVDIFVIKQELNRILSVLELLEQKLALLSQEEKEDKVHIKSMAALVVENTKNMDRLSKEYLNLASTVNNHARVINSVSDALKDHMEDVDSHYDGEPRTVQDLLDLAGDEYEYDGDDVSASSLTKKPRGNN